MKKFSEYKIIPKGKFIGDKIKIRLTDKEYKRKICGNTGWAIHCDSRSLLKKIIKKEIYEDIFKRKTSSNRKCA